MGYFFLSGFNLVDDDFPKEVRKKPFLKLVMGNETTFETKEELASGYINQIFEPPQNTNIRFDWEI